MSWARVVLRSGEVRTENGNGEGLGGDGRDE